MKRLRETRTPSLFSHPLFRFLLKSCSKVRTVKLHTSKSFDPEILSLLACTPGRDDLRELHLTVSRVAEGGLDEFLELVTLDTKIISAQNK